MTLTPDVFYTQSLKEHACGDQISRILAACLSAVEPGTLVKRALKVERNQLITSQLSLDLQEYERVFLVAIGKASFPMAVSACEILSNKITQGFVLSKTNVEIPYDWKGLNITYLLGGHPVPTQDSLDSTNLIVNTLTGLSNKDLVLILLSGGGSSLFSSPAPGISLSDLQNTTQALLRSGATINEINTLRKHISTVKGGKLAKIASPARVVTLILSDVMGDSLDMIASGLTAPDPSTYLDALNVIKKYQLEDLLPNSVTKHLFRARENSSPENPKPGDAFFDNVNNIIIGNNNTAIKAGIKQAEMEGFKIDKEVDQLEGEASLVGSDLAKILLKRIKRYPPDSKPVCTITGGETTVTIPSTIQSGKGGRNLETALSALINLDGAEDAILITLASDGEDGTTGAAGGVVTGRSYRRAVKLNLDPDQELKDHNSYMIFDNLNDLIKTGPTKTNVNDLCFIFSF